MKKIHFFAVLASVAFASCTTNEVYEEVLKTREIKFTVAPESSQTRAEHNPTTYTGGDLKIWAWINGTNTVIINGDEWNSTEGFGEGVAYYYPVGGESVDFVAIPTAFVGNGTEHYIEGLGRTNSGETTLPFVVNNSNTGRSSDNLMTTEVISQNSGQVGLILRHLFAKLKVNVQQAVINNNPTNPTIQFKVNINSLSFNNLKKQGSVTINNTWKADGTGEIPSEDPTNSPTYPQAANPNSENPDQLWGSVSDPNENWSIISTNTPLYTLNGTSVENSTPYSTTNEYYVLPQELEEENPDPSYTNEQVVTIDYTIITEQLSGNTVTSSNSANYNKTFLLSSIMNSSSMPINYWAMNKFIEYTITIDPSTSLTPISFTVSEEEWGNGSGSSPVPVP